MRMQLPFAFLCLGGCSLTKIDLPFPSPLHLHKNNFLLAKGLNWQRERKRLESWCKQQQNWIFLKTNELSRQACVHILTSGRNALCACKQPDRNWWVFSYHIFWAIIWKENGDPNMSPSPHMGVLSFFLLHRKHFFSFWPRMGRILRLFEKFLWTRDKVMLLVKLGWQRKC